MALILVIVFSGCVQNISDEINETSNIIESIAENNASNTIAPEENMLTNETINTTIPEVKIIEQQYVYSAYISLNTSSYYFLDNENYQVRLQCLKENFPNSEGNCEFIFSSLNYNMTPEEAQYYLNGKLVSLGLLLENSTVKIEFKKTDSYVFIFRDEWTSCQKNLDCVDVPYPLGCCKKSVVINVNYRDKYYQEYSKSLQTAPSCVVECYDEEPMLPVCSNNICALRADAKKFTLSVGETVEVTIVNKTFVITFNGALNETIGEVSVLNIDTIRFAKGTSEMFGDLDIYIENISYVSKNDQTMNSVTLLVGKELVKRMLNLSCPNFERIDCSPVVPPERIPYCEGTFSNWVKENCPEIDYIN